MSRIIITVLRIIFVCNYGTAKEKISFVFMGSLTTNIYNKPVFTHTGYPKVAKKLHNLFVIKDINIFFLNDSCVSTAHSENISVYTA
jgi:hypothetical protein